MTEINWMTATELVEAYKNGTTTPTEVVKTLIDRIDKINPKLNAFVTLVFDQALAAAKKADGSYKKGTNRAMEGVPVAIKDNTFTKGIRTTAGSRMFEDFVPDKNSVQVERLLDAGAIIMGKTNLPEFAMGAITDNVLFGKTLNPWDITKTPGGSSGGAAVAVAAGMCPIAQGNDAGGSIRQPASFCGVFGMKPTFGRIPNYPKFPGNETRSHQGPLTRSVEDAALMLDIMSGPSQYDVNSLPEYPGKFHEEMKKGIKGLRIAYAYELGGDSTIDDEVYAVTKKAISGFKDLGVSVKEVKPNWTIVENDVLVTVFSELYTKYENDKERFDKLAFPIYKPFLEMGTAYTNRDMVRVQYHRAKLCEQVACDFEKYDLLLTPTVTVTAFESAVMGPIGPTKINSKDPVSVGSYGRFLYPFNLTGQPAASVPCGFTSEGMPVGLQIVGRRFEESNVLRAAAAFEKAYPWRQSKPDV